MPFEIIRNDITNMSVDAIVNTANPKPVIGRGTDTAIHQKAGPKLLKARQEIGEIKCGQSAVTPAFGLDVRYVIHTVSPVWVGGKHREEDLLRQAYESALEAALAHKCRSVAFPLMAAGSYGFPKDLALSVAVRACNDFLLQHRMHITLVVFHGQAYQLSRQLVADVRSYVDEHYVEKAERREYGPSTAQLRRRREIEQELLYGESICQAPMESECTIDDLKKSLEERLQEQHETFTQSMLRIIREKDLLDPEVYGRIMMDRKTFNKIKNAPDHHPQRRTALQLSIALRLNLDQTRDLIGKAGYALTDSNRADLILTYCIQNEEYDIDTIDELLVELGEKALFTIK